jgi:MurE/MurF fusion protein
MRMASSTTPTTVASLLHGLRYTLISSNSARTMDGQLITTVAVDSRHVVPGSLFIALAGVACDGHNYIEAAVAAGSPVIICGPGRIDQARARDLQATVIEVEDTAQAYAAIAANFFHRPAEKLHFIGITGTNGKTTCTYLLEHVLLQAGLAVGVIGTVNNRYTNRRLEQKILPTRFTTPEAFLLQELLREMVDNGVDQVIMEVSSHALAQSRIGSISFDAAAFTNLSRDHLDYHTGMEDYFQAKARLFSEYMKNTGTAVLPRVHGSSEEKEWLHQLQGICDKRCRKTIRWGEEEGAEVWLRSYSTTLEQTDLVLATPSGRHTLSSPLVGRYNIDNILTVYSLCLALGLDEAFICRALATAAGAPGRLERVSTGSAWERKGPVVLVDYAHTPDALEKVLTTVAALPHNKLVCVFGCGGDRDQGKRPLMGEIAGKLCDIAVVTDDNPRNEDPERIVAQILSGLRKTTLPRLEVKNDISLQVTSSKDFGYVVIRDRQKAIDAAIRAASPGDIVVIAGKGHEPYQLTLQGKRFFDDRLAAKRVLFSWTAELVATAAGGRLYPGKNPIDSTKLLGPVITDSRLVSRDGIFVALKGESHDAHDFAWQAVENGAACLVVEKRLSLPPELAVCQVEVEDTSQALGDMAAFRRRQLAGQCDQVIIGLTGSCGKTTVKEMVAAILARMWPAGPDFPAECVLKTKGNFNNLIGLPLSLLPLDVEHRAAVLEMGMNRPGELKRLGAIADPDISCITNIHGAHLEGLQSIEGVARAKEELFAATKESGILVVNLDDRRICELLRKYTHRKITFAVHGSAGQQQADLWSSEMHMAEGGAITFTLHYREEAVGIRLFIAGEHNVSNALCAAAIGLAAGASLQHIAAGLADFRPPDKRMEMLRARSGFTIINDTYNANPASMAAGLKTLRMIAGKASVAVIGDMRELGAAARQAHYDIGTLIAELAIDWAGVVGEFKKDVVQGALDHGYPEDRLFLFEDKEGAARWIHDLVDRKKLGQDDLVLVKASRGLRFETIVGEIIDF